MKTWIRIGAVLLMSAAVLFIGLQVGRPFHLAVGSGEDRYIEGWRSDDEVITGQEPRRYYRWVIDQGRLRLPFSAMGGALDVRIHAHRHLPGMVSVIANFEEVFSEQIDPAPWRDYVFTVPAEIASRGPLTLLFLTSSTPEDLVLAVDSIDVGAESGAWVIPATGLAAAWLASALLLLLATRATGHSRFSTLVVVASLAVAATGLWFWKIPTITIVSRLWMLLLFVLIATHLGRRLLAGSLWAPVFVGGMFLHGVVYFHPYLYPPDLHYHFRFAEKLTRMSLTEIYRVSVMYDIPGNFSLNYPYSPVFHLVAGMVSPQGADLKYIQKLIILIAYGIAGLCLVKLLRRFELGPLGLALYFMDPTLLRHLYRCHMPGMFGISSAAIFLLLLSAVPLASLTTRRSLLWGLFLAFAMCTYPASFLQLSIFSGFFVVLVALRSELRPEAKRMLWIGLLALAVSIALFYGQYIHLIWQFFMKSRLQVTAAGRTASITGMIAIWLQILNLEKAWPFYLPAIAGIFLMKARVADARWRAIQAAWALTFIAQVVLTSDYLLPSVRVHIKEMAFLTPVVLIWQAESFEWLYRKDRILPRAAAVGMFAILAVLSLHKIHGLILGGFAMP